MRRFLFMMLLVVSVFAQSGNVGVRLNIANPIGEFAENVENLGVGFDADFVYSPVPYFGLGFGGGYLNYGREEYEESFSGTISRVFVDVTTTNNLSYLDLSLRGIAPLGVVKPYIEGKVGGSYLWTETKIENQNHDDEDNEIASSTNFDDFAFNYGFGGGVLIRLRNNMDVEDDDVAAALYLDLRVIYMSGGNAEYLTEGSIVENQVDGGITYNFSESQTSYTSFQLGVVFEFGAAKK